MKDNTIITMKKQLLCLGLIAPLLVACHTPTDSVSRIATGQPIIPIRMTSDTAHVVLTDYVPLLMEQQSQPPSESRGTIAWQASGRLETLNMTGTGALPEEIDIVNHSNVCEEISICNNKANFAIPVLPNKPVKQGFVSMRNPQGAMHCITVGFVDPTEVEKIMVYVQNMPITSTSFTPNEDGSYTLDLFQSKEVSRCGKGRAYLRVFAEDSTYLYNDLLIPLQDGNPITDVALLTRHDNQAQVLYSILVDRFQNGNTDNDWKMNSPEVLDIVDYQGGDLAGITQKIKEGYFSDLGVNTLWISPITQNPWDAWGKYVFHHGNKYDSTKTYTKFSGYHGYWPIYVTAIDKRFGTDYELEQLLACAHTNNMNVVLDYVANHMHINAPTLQEHPDWHTDSILPDGRRNFELWDEARLTTWFDAHIPTLDLEREEVCRPMTDSALYWLENYDFDGFRHDACKHIPECYWRMLGQKMAVRFPDRPIWMIGETYGSPELINSYVKTGMLNAQFDFNVYFTAVHALCNDGSMQNLDNTIRTSLATYGAHHTMGNISGNHDQVRFASFAGGAVGFWEDPKEAGWTRYCGIVPNDQTDNTQRIEEAYKRALLLEVLNLTLPGVPCIYQGDEYAEVGGNDPDNRHMMRFDGLNEYEQNFRQQVKDLIHLRRSSMPLLYGDYIPVSATDDVLCFDRVYMGETMRVEIDRKNLTYSITKQ